MPKHIDLNKVKTGFRGAEILDNGHVRGPRCCGARMTDDGGCYEGCCDDYKCDLCGRKVRVEWPD